MDIHSVVIVGAGPAGMNAAFHLAEHEVKCTVIDENSMIGGVVYRGPLRAGNHSVHNNEKTKKKIEAIRRGYERYSEYIKLCLNTQVLGAMNDTAQLAVLDPKRFYAIDYNYLIVSTGCYEKAVPFPGWTLPGVMTIGGVQLQVKSGLVRPGKRIILVGTGPLLPIAAMQLHLAGVEVAGVYESGRRIDLARNIFSLLKNPPLLREGLACHYYLKKAGVPFHYGWGLVEARGVDELKEVVLAPYDDDWRPVRGKEQVIEVDCLGVEYGFQSRSQLSQLLGLEHQFDQFSGLRPVRDEWGRGSSKHTYIAGDVAGVYGAHVAAEQGKLAALAILTDSGMINRDKAERLAVPIKKTMKGYIKFQQAFDDFSRPRPGLLDLPGENTVVCRCENITRGQIDQALGQGVKDITTLKMVTRIAMGDCQGKLCSSFCYDYMQRHLGKEDIGILRPRFPLAPLSFQAIVKHKEVA